MEKSSRLADEEEEEEEEVGLSIGALVQCCLWHSWPLRKANTHTQSVFLSGKVRKAKSAHKRRLSRFCWRLFRKFVCESFQCPLFSAKLLSVCVCVPSNGSEWASWKAIERERESAFAAISLGRSLHAMGANAIGQSNGQRNGR